MDELHLRNSNTLPILLQLTKVILASHNPSETLTKWKSIRRRELAMPSPPFFSPGILANEKTLNHDAVTECDSFIDVPKLHNLD
jgi:hypothetical protein